MVKKKILFVLSGLLLCIATYAKEIKRPDSYAFTRGVEAYTQQNYSDAKDWFDKEISDHPENGYPYTYLAAIYYANDDNGSALSAINEAIKKLPKKDKEYTALAYQSRAKIYFELEDTIKGLADLDRSIKIDPTFQTNYEVRGQINYEKGNYRESDADYDRIISMNQGDVMGYMGKGRNANAEGRYDDALKEFNFVIKLAPEYSSGYAFRAETYISQERWAEAVEDIVAALTIDGNDKAYYLIKKLPDDGRNQLISKLKLQGLKNPNDAYWPYIVASIYYDNDEYSPAEEYFNKANSISPDPYYLRKIANVQRYQNRLDEALNTVIQALNMNPDDIESLELEASILSPMGRIEEAIAEREKALAINPNRPFTYYENAIDKMKLGEFDKALEDLEISAASSSLLPELSFFLISRGDANRLNGNSAQAANDYGKVLDNNQENTPGNRQRRAMVLSGLGQKDEALEILNKLTLENLPTDSLAYDELFPAIIYARINDNETALKEIKKAVDNGYDDYVSIATNYNFIPLRNNPEFINLVENLKPVEEKVARGVVVSETPVMQLKVTEVPFTKEGGVTKVKCTINDLPLYFIFDTGASDVTISMVEANFMLKNGYIKPSDIIGSQRYVDANGDVSEGTVINLNKVNFGGLELDNVRASVVRNQRAPLLLGQSVLGRLGRIEIDNNSQTLKITSAR